jgi:Zn-finger nucleic acid-binding protein
MSNREGIEIDYCPTCRGVWLDRGELDKIIERSASEQAPPPVQRSEPYGDRERYREHDDDRYREHGYHKRKRKGLLGDLFDFD